jgi:hypothetical protein
MLFIDRDKTRRRLIGAGIPVPFLQGAAQLNEILPDVIEQRRVEGTFFSAGDFGCQPCLFRFILKFLAAVLADFRVLIVIEHAVTPISQAI